MFKAIKGFFSEFQKFASRGNFLDLAIGIVIGTSFTAVTTALVNDVITPPIGLLLGRINFQDLAIPLGGTVKITYGLFFQALINFIITALALFILVRIVNRLEDTARRHRKAAAVQSDPAPADSPEVAILKEIRDALKGREESSVPEPESGSEDKSAT